MKTEYTHEVSAAPEAVFPLLCPVREYEWLDGWACQTIYSESGVAEEGCIFRTAHGPSGPSTWFTTRYEPPARIEFVVTAKDVVTRLSIALERTGAGSRLHWTRLFTGLTGEGNENIGWWTIERDRRLGRRLDCFLKTGKMLRAPEAPSHRGWECRSADVGQVPDLPVRALMGAYVSAYG